MTALNEKAAAWVTETLNGMTVEEKIGQLFCVLGVVPTKSQLEFLTGTVKIGGIMYRPSKAEQHQQTLRRLQAMSRIPLLTAANLERGGAGAAVDGTSYANPMGCAATGKAESGYRLGKISCAEGAAVGVNWAFAPVVDIDMNFRNPITNLRTFGSDYRTVIDMASGYLKAAKEEKVAVSIKHFPGDGVDERDQHLLTSVNSLSVKEWDESYGRIYQTLIDQGAEAVMVGHIAQPAYVKELNSNAAPAEQYFPASLNPYLLQGLLRGRLGFKGLIVTDASGMLGFTCAMPRRDAVPRCIAAGCDMLLFNKNLKEDYAFMVEGCKNGVITPERLDEAVTHILTLKASLGLPEKQKTGTLTPDVAALNVVGCKQHSDWTDECADDAITLVKDTQQLLPLSPQKFKRIYLNVMENQTQKKSALAGEIKARLEAEGFTVTLRDRTLKLNMERLKRGLITPGAIKLLKEASAGVEDFKSKYDLCVYVANHETESSASVVRLHWKVMLGMGNDAPWFTAEVPTLFISTANPYHLLDAPMMKTMINAYTANKSTIPALIEKIMGRSAFKGKSPVDVFCGHGDTAL
jgi:beta-N-acetylhexosaminidase